MVAGTDRWMFAAKSKTLAQVRTSKPQNIGRTRMLLLLKKREGTRKGMPLQFAVLRYGRSAGCSSASDCSIALRMELMVDAVVGLLRPRARPPPRPTSSATMPTRMGTHTGVPPAPLEVVLDGVVLLLVAVAVADGFPAFVFTMKANAPAGAFAFIVNTKAGNPSATATATSNSTTPSNTTSSGAGGTPVWVPILVGIVALLVGLGGGLALGRSRPTTASTISSMRRAIEQSEADEQPAERP